MACSGRQAKSAFRSLICCQQVSGHFDSAVIVARTFKQGHSLHEHQDNTIPFYGWNTIIITRNVDSLNCITDIIYLSYNLNFML